MTNKSYDVWKRISIGKDNECWNYNGCLHEDGYGRMDYGGSKKLVHRLIYEFTFGIIPDKLQVLHHCDNPRCCNPNHLFLGTHEDNMKDMINKNRQRGPTGIKNSHNKLTSAQVKEIKILYSTGNYYQQKLADMFGVTQSTISSICRGKSWIILK